MRLLMADVLYRQAAQFYEALYRKNLKTPAGVKRENDNIEAMLQRNATQPLKAILDMGCGSGVHAVELANRGYEVTAVDYAQEMVDLAKKRPKTEGAKIEFMQGDMRNYKAQRKFDAAICMTNAFLCNHDDAHISAALDSFAQCIREGGVLLLEVTSYLSMMAQGEFKYTYVDTAKVDGNEVVEISDNTPDLKHGVLEEKNTYFISDGNGKYDKHYCENKLRLITIPDLVAAMKNAGFETTELIDAETLHTATPLTIEYFVVGKRTA